jgi:flavin-dependent dehydrogenase
MKVDVLVVGGGPAGSCLAARLAQLGHRTALVERATFPRRSLGESLSPGVLPLLRVTGAAEAIAVAGFTPARTVIVDWDEGPREWAGMAEPGLLVDRGRFDLLLVSHARGLGVQVFQPAHVRSLSPAGEGWRAKVVAGDRSVDIEARFVADAAGRAGALPSRRLDPGPRTLALYGYWVGDRLPTRPRIEAAEDAWLWGVPLPDGSYNTLVFVDAERVRGAGRRGVERLFHESLQDSSLLEGSSGIRLSGPVRAADATPYLDEDPVSERSIKVGEAALAIDPISSSGVQKAIQSAISGAVVVNTLLRSPDARDAALRFHRESLTRAARRHRAWASSHYARVHQRRLSASFWSDRAGAPDDAIVEQRRPPALDQPLAVSSELAFVEEPCIVGDFIDTREAVSHPGLEGPVAFVGGRPLAPLLRNLPPQVTPPDAVRRLSAEHSVDAGLAVLTWLVRHELLVPAQGSAPNCDRDR